MVTFLDLPVEIRLRIYRELQLPQPRAVSWGKSFAVEAPYNYPRNILEISRQVSQEARMAYSAISKRTWKINVIASADAKLSLLDGLPDGLAQSAHVQFKIYFSRERDNLAIQPHVSYFPWGHLQAQQRVHGLFQAVRQVSCDINEICRRLAEIPVRRDIEICWSDFGEIRERAIKQTVLHPFSTLRKSCSFRLGKVSAWQDDSGQELASYLEVVTGPVPILKDLRSQS